MNLIFTTLKPASLSHPLETAYKTAVIGLKDSIRKDLEPLGPELRNMDIPITIDLKNMTITVDSDDIPEKTFKLIQRALEKKASLN